MFVLDEMDFPTVSKATSQSLRPVWYKGEATSQQSGLFHPPLYIYSLAFFIRNFSFSEMTVRIFGMICALATSYLLISMLKLFNYRNRWGEVLLLGLFLLNPYTLACATVPDIDTTIMPLTMLMFIYLSLRFYWKKNFGPKYDLLILSSVFALNLWTKLTTPLMLPVFLFALLIICRKSVLASLLITLKIALLGAAMFLITYFVFTKLVNLPMSYTFTFLAQSFFKGTLGNETLLHKVLTNASYIKSQVYWFTIPLTLAYIVSLFSIGIHRKYTEQDKVMLLLSLFGLAIFVFYICLISPFGGFFKYPFPAFGLMILTIIFCFQNYLAKIKTSFYLSAFIFITIFVLTTHFVGDKAFLDHAVFRHFILLTVAATVGYALLHYNKTAQVGRVLFVYFLIFVIGYQLAISRVQAIATYPTKYLYGQQGMRDTVSYLKIHTHKNEIIWSMKDVGFYVNDRYYESYAFYFNKNLEPVLTNMLQQGKIRYYVGTVGIGEDRLDYYTGVTKILNDNATKVATYGNFVIYRSNAAANN